MSCQAFVSPPSLPFYLFDWSSWFLNCILFKHLHTLIHTKLLKKKKRGKTKNKTKHCWSSTDDGSQGGGNQNQRSRQVGLHFDCGSNWIQPWNRLACPRPASKQVVLHLPQNLHTLCNWCVESNDCKFKKEEEEEEEGKENSVAILLLLFLSVCLCLSFSLFHN